MGVLDAFRLGGKIALVTGAGRGLGRGMAIGLAEAGADLCLIDRIDASETVAHIRDLGRQCEAFQIDLSELDETRAAQIINTCREALGGLDILVNNAGIIRRAPGLEFSGQDWHEVLDINLNSVFFLSQAAARHFVLAGVKGKIINIASMLSFQGGLMVPSYAASKSAVLGLTRALANEWAAKGINVNAVAPGYLVSDVTAGLRADPQRNQAILDRIPAGRWGMPEDLKGAVVFLASEAADYVHGAVLPVDGGWLAR